MEKFVCRLESTKPAECRARPHPKTAIEQNLIQMDWSCRPYGRWRSSVENDCSRLTLQPYQHKFSTAPQEHRNRQDKVAFGYICAALTKAAFVMSRTSEVNAVQVKPVQPSSTSRMQQEFCGLDFHGRESSLFESSDICLFGYTSTHN